jgi:hypothetical protein
MVDIADIKAASISSEATAALCPSLRVTLVGSAHAAASASATSNDPAALPDTPAMMSPVRLVALSGDVGCGLGRPADAPHHLPVHGQPFQLQSAK